MLTAREHRRMPKRLSLLPLTLGDASRSKLVSLLIRRLLEIGVAADQDLDVLG